MSRKRKRALLEGLARIEGKPVAEIEARVPAGHRERGAWFAAQDRRVTVYVRDIEGRIESAHQAIAARYLRAGLAPEEADAAARARVEAHAARPTGGGP